MMLAVVPASLSGDCAVPYTATNPLISSLLPSGGKVVVVGGSFPLSGVATRLKRRPRP